MDKIEISAFLRLFCDKGYVLDFSTGTFDIFTMDSVGIPLCQKYGLSKGASLTAFCHEANDMLVYKLLSDLLRYYEIHFVETINISEEKRKLYKKCTEFIEKNSREIKVVSSQTIEKISHFYIKNISERIIADINNKEYDSAITKSRTLLEEVFCFVIEEKDEVPSDKGDIGKLYNHVKQLYNMHQSKDIDKRINGLLSGLEKILTAISEMRNINSDAHGVGSRRINIEEHHAQLFANSAITMANFILAVYENNKTKNSNV